jgi:hypothetical protein
MIALRADDLPEVFQAKFFESPNGSYIGDHGVARNFFDFRFFGTNQGQPIELPEVLQIGNCESQEANW